MDSAADENSGADESVPPAELEDGDFGPDDEDGAIRQLGDLIAYVAKALVDVPDEVRVDAVDGDRSIIFELMVAPKDLGKVIGREGRTARAMRTLLSATSAKLEKRAVLDIIED